MINSPIAALATGLMASQRLENVPSAEPFRNNFFVSSLLCGNAAAQLLFNMRTADDLAEVLKSRAAIEDKLKTALGENAKLRLELTAKINELGEVQKAGATSTGEIKKLPDEKEKKLNADPTTKITELTAPSDRLPEHLVILEHPKISGQAIAGQKFTAAWGKYEDSQKDAKKTRSWVVDGQPQALGDEFTPDPKNKPKEVFLREEFPTLKGKVTVESLPIKIT